MKVKISVSLALALAFAAALPAQKKGETETRSLHGTVTTKSGDPIEGAVVHLKNTKTLQIRTYISDKGGEFHFQGLSLTNDYQVHAEHEGATSPVRTISSFDNRKEVHVTLKVEKKS